MRQLASVKTTTTSQDYLCNEEYSVSQKKSETPYISYTYMKVITGFINFSLSWYCGNKFNV